MLTWTVATFVTLLEASWLRTTTPAVNPGCQCVEYDGFAGAQTNGSFLSPNWPEPYEEDIECLLYQFVGASGELVEITFFQFELAPKDPVSGRCMDYVRIYQDLEDDAAVNEKSLWQHELCGADLAPGSKFYSKGRALIFEFHSAALNHARMNKGFVGEYHFLKKRDYHIDGRRMQGEGCHYMIKSSEEQLKGNIYSPHFPYYYPPDTKCIYYFHASPGQNIQIVVKELHIPPPIDATCDFADDYLVIYDEGSGSNGNSLVLLEKLCRPTDKGVLRISSRQHVQLHFITGANEDYEGRGFHATYEFVNELPTPPPINGFGEAAEVPAIIQPKSGDCQLRISSEDGKKSGNVSSPDYPATYPVSSTRRASSPGTSSSNHRRRRSSASKAQRPPPAPTASIAIL
uniref:CUB domain-containing protein n=1 Tax=Plectus sambesii TaxID=2011161 RepID=A0A914WC50_9BILA